VRVGRVLRDLDLTWPDGTLTPIGRRVLGCAMGVEVQRDDQRLYAATKRLTRWLRKLRIVAPPPVPFLRRRFSWHDDDGERVSVTYCVEIS